MNAKIIPNFQINLWSVGTIIVTVTLAYSGLQYSIKDIAKRQDAQDAAIATVAREANSRAVDNRNFIQSNELRVRSLEEFRAGNAADLRNIQQNTNDIKQSVRELGEKIDRLARRP